MDVPSLTTPTAPAGPAQLPPMVVPQPLFHGSAVNQPKTFGESGSLKIQAMPTHHCSSPAPQQDIGGGWTAGISHSNAHKFQMSGQEDAIDHTGRVSTHVEIVDKHAGQMGKEHVQSSVVPWPLPSDAHTTEVDSSQGARRKTGTLYPGTREIIIGTETELNQNPEDKARALQEEEWLLLAKIQKMAANSSPVPGSRGKKRLIPDFKEIDTDVIDPKIQSEMNIVSGNLTFEKSVDEPHHLIGSCFTVFEDISLADARQVGTLELSEAVQEDEEGLNQGVNKQV